MQSNPIYFKNTLQFDHYGICLMSIFHHARIPIRNNMRYTCYFTTKWQRERSVASSSSDAIINVIIRPITSIAFWSSSR